MIQAQNTHGQGSRPLTQREQRTLNRMQIKWAKKTITAEEKGLALALSDRAWRASKASDHEAELTDRQIDDLACEWVYIRAGQESEQYEELRKFARAVIAAQQPSAISK